MTAVWWMVGSTYAEARFHVGPDAPGGPGRRRPSRRGLDLDLEACSATLLEHANDPAIANLRSAISARLQRRSKSHVDLGDALLPFSEKVLGVMVVRPRFRLDNSLRTLSVRQRQLVRFWNLLYRFDVESSLAMFDVVAAIPFETPQVCFTQGSRFMKTRFFARLSEVSAVDMLECRTLGGQGRCVADCLQQVGEDFDIDLPAAPLVAVSMYIPHVFLLCADATWTSYCIPLFGDTRRGLGTDMIPQTMAALEQAQRPEQDFRREPLNARFLQEVADAIRHWSPQLGEGGREERTRFVQVLQSNVDELVDPMLVFHVRNWAYPVEHLINAFVMSTLLRDAGSLAETCRRAVSLCFSPRWSELWLDNMTAKVLTGVLLVRRFG